MDSMWLTPELWLLLVPMVMALVGLVPSRVANRIPVVMGRGVQIAGGVSLLLWLVALVTAAVGGGDAG